MNQQFSVFPRGIAGDADGRMLRDCSGRACSVRVLRVRVGSRRNQDADDFRVPQGCGDDKQGDSGAGGDARARALDPEDNGRWPVSRRSFSLPQSADRRAPTRSRVRPEAFRPRICIDCPARLTCPPPRLLPGHWEMQKRPFTERRERPGHSVQEWVKPELAVLQARRELQTT